jgi:hypothetical protein
MNDATAVIVTTARNSVATKRCSATVMGALFVNTVIAPSTICTAITPTDIRAGPRT